MKTKICPKCGKEKDVGEFSKSKTTKDGLFSWCKKCQKKRLKLQVQKHPIKWWCRGTINFHKWSGYKVLFTFRELLPLAKRTKVCPICGIKLKWHRGKRQSNSPTLDRKENQKTLTLKNVWIICDKCNRTKQDRTFEEFVNYCRMVGSKF